MAKRKKKNKHIIEIIFDIALSVVLGVSIIWKLGLIPFIGYSLAFYTAIKNKLFFKKRDMAGKLFLGTILIFIAGLFLPRIFDSILAGNLVTAGLMILLAIYLWLTGRKVRKKGHGIIK